MRKKLLIGASLSLLIISLISTIAYAVSWTFNFPVTVTDTSNTTRNNYPVSLNATGQLYINGGYINSNGLNTNMQIGTMSIPYMVATDHITTVLSQLPSGGKTVVTFYTGYSPQQTSFSIITGSGGFITTNDTAALELSSNGSIQIRAFIDGTQPVSNVFYKPGAFKVLLDAGNNMTAILSSLSIFNNSPNTLDLRVGNGSIIRQGERLNSFAISYYTSANLTLQKIGAPTGTANITIRKVSDDSILANLGTIDVSTIPAAYTNYTFAYNGTGAFVNPSVQDVRLLVEYNGGDAGNYINLLGQLADVYPGGVETSYVAAYTDVAGDDVNFAVFSGTRLSFVISSIGLKNISLINAGGSFTFTMDSDTATTTNVTVPDINSNIVWGSVVTPYFVSINMTIGGNQKLSYQPNTMITNDQLTDLDGTKNGDITWGTNTNILLHAGTMVSNNSTSSTGSNATIGFTMPTVQLPNNWFGGGTQTTLPFYDMFSAVSSQSGMSTQMIYFIIAIAFAFLAMLLVMRFTHSNLLGIIIFNSILFMGTSNNVVPMWVAFSSTLVQIGILYLSRQV